MEVEKSKLAIKLMSVTVLLGGCAFVVPATVSTDGQQSNGGESAGPALSCTGRFVAFNSDAHNLVPGDLNSSRDVFVRDLVTKVTERVSITTAGAEPRSERHQRRAGRVRARPRDRRDDARQRRE